jgi:hypothetical protein
MTDNFKFTKSQKKIAEQLQLHPSTISLDCQYLKEKAQKELETHIEDKIPLEYMKCREGYRKILEIGNAILDKPNIDDKVKLQAMQVLANTYKMVMDLTSDGLIVQQALKKIRKLAEYEQSDEDKKLEEELIQRGELEAEEEEAEGEENEAEAEEQE